jgi:hypothetical protein
MDNNQNQNFFIKLLSGNLGLAKTYWIYGVVVHFIFMVIVSSAEGEKLKGVIAVIFVTYMIVWLVGFFNATMKYEGLFIWWILSMVIIMPIWIWNIFIYAMVAKSYFMD